MAAILSTLNLLTDIDDVAKLQINGRTVAFITSEGTLEMMPLTTEGGNNLRELGFGVEDREDEDLSGGGKYPYLKVRF